MANYHGSIEALECDIHSVTYDLAVNRGAGSHLGCLTRSPTTLQRRPYDQSMPEPDRYDIVLESRAGGRLIWPHQVTYDVVATPIRSINA
eukprot:scaffold20242_cov74-Skeletonema_dohrnii-CCMP3373.AAC.1